MDKAVVLPAPLGPNSPKQSPLSIPTYTSFTALFLPALPMKSFTNPRFVFVCVCVCVCGRQGEERRGEERRGEERRGEERRGYNLDNSIGFALHELHSLFIHINILTWQLHKHRHNQYRWGVWCVWVMYMWCMTQTPTHHVKILIVIQLSLFAFSGRLVHLFWPYMTTMIERGEERGERREREEREERGERREERGERDTIVL